MYCSECGSKNRTQSRFCKECGVKLRTSSGRESLAPLLNAKIVTIAILVLMLGGSTVFAAPKAKDYFEVNKLVQNAQELENEGKYQEALDVLNLTESKWTLSSKIESIIDFKQKEELFIKDKDTLAEARSRKFSGDLEEARSLLQSISPEFPEYEIAEDLLTVVQLAIEEELKDKVKLKEQEAAAAAAKAASSRARAEAETAARKRAEREKEEQASQAAAAAVRAASAANDARAAAAATRAAEEEAVRVAAKAAQDKRNSVLSSFRNDLTSAYNTYAEASDFYDDAIRTFNTGYALSYADILVADLTVISALVSEVLGDVNYLDQYKNMPATYIQASSNMRQAANNLLTASSKLIDDIVNDTCCAANYYSGLADTYISNVYQFLLTNR